MSEVKVCGAAVGATMGMIVIAAIAVAASVEVDKDGKVSFDEKLFEEIYKTLVGAYIPSLDSGTSDSLNFQSLIDDVKANRTRVTKVQLEELFKKHEHFMAAKVNDDMVKSLNNTLNKYIIDGCSDDEKIKDREKMFLAQCLHESCRTLTEQYDGDPDVYFINVQGGAKYRGAGFIQLTHKENYEKFAEAMNDPQIVEKGYSYVASNYAWEAGGFWWESNGMNQFVDQGDSLQQISNAVNLGPGKKDMSDLFSNGWADRQRAYDEVCEVIK